MLATNNQVSLLIACLSALRILPIDVIYRWIWFCVLSSWAHEDMWQHTMEDAPALFLVALQTWPLRILLIPLKRSVEGCHFTRSHPHVGQTHNRRCYCCRAQLCVVQQRLERPSVPQRIRSAKDEVPGKDSCNWVQNEKHTDGITLSGCLRVAFFFPPCPLSELWYSCCCKACYWFLMLALLQKIPECCETGDVELRFRWRGDERVGERLQRERGGVFRQWISLRVQMSN